VFRFVAMHDNVQTDPWVYTTFPCHSSILESAIRVFTDLRPEAYDVLLLLQTSLAYRT
jgi:hypothetical protein